MYKGTCINASGHELQKQTGGLPHPCGRPGPGPSLFDGSVLTILGPSGVLPSKLDLLYTIGQRRRIGRGA